MELRLRTLGRSQLCIDGRLAPPPPTQKARALVAYLALSRTRDVSREHLIERFWPEFEPERAREGLRTALSAIRRSLRQAGTDPSQLLDADRSVVRWLHPVAIDADELETAAGSSDRNAWRTALGLYGGDFLEGHYDEWAVAQRERYAELYETILGKLVRECGDADAARLLLSRNPYDESAYLTLIEAERKVGRHAAARELLTRYRVAAQEAGVDPSAEVLARFQDVDELPVVEGVISLPFVARTRELQRLGRGMQQCDEGHAYCAVVSGDAGIGKTSLLVRSSHLAARAGGVPFMVAALDDEGASTVWGSLYRQVTGIAIDELAASATDVPGSIAAAMIAFPRAAVLFVDDAHTLRGEALATLVELARLARASSVALIVAMRPEGLVQAGALLRAYVDDEIALGPLRREDVATAVTLAIGMENPQLDELLFARSEGHPLFLVALLQSLVRDRTLDRERGRWRITRELDTRLELPRDLRASIETRLRAAGEDAAVVACALALEPSATAEELAAALSYPQDRVFDALDQLLAFALIAGDAREIRFHFLHDLVREVAGGMLNAGRRVALHREFARLFETDMTPEGRAKLARHLHSAGLTSRAARAYLEAASGALHAYAFHDGLQWCTDGLAALEHAQQRPDIESLLLRLCEIRAEMAVHVGAFALAKEAASATARSARALQDPRATGAALVLRSALQGILGEPTQRLADALEARRIAADANDAALMARADVQASASARVAGMSDDALLFAVSGRDAAHTSNDRVAEYAAYEELLRAQIAWWRFGEARETLAAARIAAEAAGLAAQARLECVRAWLYSFTEQLAEARVALAQAFGLLEYLGKHRDSAPPDAAHPLLVVRFVRSYLEGLVSVVQEDWDGAMATVANCRHIALIAELGPYRDALVTLESNVALSTNSVDLDVAVPETPLPGPLFLTIDCKALIEARLAARILRPNYRSALRTALDALEDRANAMPLDCDRAFRQLGAAATECGETAIAIRANARSDHYYALRMAAAAVHKSVRPRISSGSMSRPSV